MTHDRRNELGQPIGFPVPDWTQRPRPLRTVMEGRDVAVEPSSPRLTVQVVVPKPPVTFMYSSSILIRNGLSGKPDADATDRVV